MTLRYQTGTATLIQFIVMTTFNFVDETVSAVHGCLNGDGCFTSVSVNLMYLLLIAAWYGLLAVLGFAAQDKRRKLIIQVLLGAEAFLAFVELYINARHNPPVLTLVTSLVDAAFAIWVSVLAWRLLRARGARVSPTTARKRRPAKT